MRKKKQQESIPEIQVESTKRKTKGMHTYRTKQYYYILDQAYRTELERLDRRYGYYHTVCDVTGRSEQEIDELIAQDKKGEKAKKKEKTIKETI